MKGEDDREFDLRDALQNLIERHGHRGAFRFRNAVLTVTIFGRNGPRSRCVDPSGSECSDYFGRVITQDATLGEMERFRRRLGWYDSCEDCPDEYPWGTGRQAPKLLSGAMVTVTPRGPAQPKQIRNPTPMREFLYNACFDGVWPIQCIEGYKNWDSGPIRFFYDDFRSAFRAWCKRSGISPGGKGIKLSSCLVHEDLNETFPDINTRLRCRVPDGSPVQRTPSDGRARAVELPSLIDCRKDFDRIFKSPQAWDMPRAKDHRRAT
jgi:hypothetical protein